MDYDVEVHLLPALVPPGRLTGSIAVVMDVLRATTTMITALANGCRSVRPCGEIEEARLLAQQLRDEGQLVLLGGERGGLPIPGFDLGNSPAEYTPNICAGATLVMTTTNGTRALLCAAEAETVLVAGFVNLNALRQLLVSQRRSMHLVCAGTDGAVTLEDVLLAGAIVSGLYTSTAIRLNNSAQLAWDCFESQGFDLMGAFEQSAGGMNLLSLGLGDDLRLAAQVNRYAVVPELRRQPLRVEASVSTERSRRAALPPAQ